MRKTQTAIVAFEAKIWLCGQTLKNEKGKKVDSPEKPVALLIP